MFRIKVKFKSLHKYVGKSFYWVGDPGRIRLIKSVSGKHLIFENKDKLKDNKVLLETFESYLSRGVWKFAD